MKRNWFVTLTFGFLAVTATADDKAAQADKEKLQGTWALVAGKRDGKEMPEERVKAVQLVIAGDKFTVKNKDRERTFTLKLYPDKKPKAIDVDMDGTVGEGIYELDGDNLKLIHGEAGDPRPTEFVSKEGSKRTLMIFKRAKP